MSTNGPGARVLLAEDEEGLATLYASWLREHHEVTVVADGTAALEAYDGHDVVLLDRMMPELSGGETLGALRDRGIDVPVAMVTAVEPDLDLAGMPFDEYLYKPVPRADLREAVSRLAARGAYDDRLRRHYALAAKLATLEEHVPASELAGSEAYAELEAEFAALDADLFDAGGDLDDDDLAAVLRGGDA
ncbi:HalX domain-containing protein [Halosegnis marinus]|uniref:HalX domain-containing protein n=1 Tax=Halosegnis marinus TaxID=3034023 RepID=A0ABD5ZKZ2_9EURY|nr:HalX domain-containing protein [Halosegnis sp. DT85]